MSESLDKLEELRNADRNPTQEDNEWYNQLEKDIKKREQYQNFLDHPVTKEIVERIIAWITDANNQLLVGKGGPDLVVRRDNLIDILSIFSPSRAKTDHITKQLEPKIKEFREYYENH